MPIQSFRFNPILLLALAVPMLTWGCKADPLPKRRIPVPESPSALQRGGRAPMRQSVQRPQANSRPQVAKAGVGSIAGLSWKIPSKWKLGPRRRMRVATYIIPSPYRNRYANGECSIFYFGRNQGGGLTANLERWKGQFRPESGKTALTLAKTNQTTIKSIKVATLEVRGTFMSSPRPMASQKVPKPGYHMLAAIAAAPQGLVFFKCVGPHIVMLQSKAEFNGMLNSFSK